MNTKRVSWFILMIAKNEVDFVVEYFNIRPHVRIITAIELDNELHLRKIFDLI